MASMKNMIFKLIPARRQECHSQSDDEVKEGLLPSQAGHSWDGELVYCHRCRQMTKKSALWTFAFRSLTGLAIINCLLIAAVVSFYVTTLQKTFTTPLLSPTFKDFPSEIKPKTWNLEFFTSNDSAIFRHPPSLEVDTAWAEASYPYILLVDREDVEAAGADLQYALRPPQSWNVTGEKYLATLDVQHQVHCLDSLRESAFADHYYTRGELENPLYWPHLIHCLDIVRQSLMCHANNDLMVYVWAENQVRGYVPPTLDHQCTDWDAIQQWQKERAIPEEMYTAYLKPEGVAQIGLEAEYYEMLPVMVEYQRTHPEFYVKPHHH